MTETTHRQNIYDAYHGGDSGSRATALLLRAIGWILLDILAELREPDHD